MVIAEGQRVKRQGKGFFTFLDGKSGLLGGREPVYTQF
jgi:hypothetical protein